MQKKPLEEKLPRASFGSIISAVGKTTVGIMESILFK